MLCNGPRSYARASPRAGAIACPRMAADDSGWCSAQPSNDGQTILASPCRAGDHGPGLQFLVELRGFDSASRVPAGAPASAACSIKVSDSTVGTHDDRHTTRPSASSTRTECLDAIPRSTPTSRRGCPASSCTISTFPCIVGLNRLRLHSRQQPNGHGPTVQEPGNGSHSCAATGPCPSELGHFPHPGHPWPGQQWQSNPRGPGYHPASEPSSSPPTRPAGDAHATLEPLR
jgi:hypothetical protein